MTTTLLLTGFTILFWALVYAYLKSEERNEKETQDLIK